MSNQNKYGLIVRDKPTSKLSFQASRNVFGSDDSDDDAGRKPILTQINANKSKQIKNSQKSALLEDPTVFQYDEVYDSMTKEKESKKTKNTNKKPKYIENLLKTANKRKLENERRVERQIQKEREKEGDEFADKDVFVTTAYKKKLEELRLEEEKEKYQDYLESVGDVTRQQDLGGFYRHLYEQKLGASKNEQIAKSDNDSKDDSLKNQDIDKSEKSENESIADSVKKPDIDQNANSEIESETDNSQKLDTDKTLKHLNKQAKQRNYRKRKSSKDNNLSEGEIEDSDEEIKFSNLDDIKTFKKTKFQNIDADSDFVNSSDSESSEMEEETKSKTVIEKSEQKIIKPDIPTPVKVTPTKEKKVILKVDIWKKRTVGEVFDQALKRYYERKAARSG